MRTRPSAQPPSGERLKTSRPILQEDELKLYRLIWMRFIASQMMPAVFDQTTIDVAARGQGRRDIYVPRHRQRAEVQRLPGGIRRGQGPEGRRGRGTEESAAAGDARRGAALQVDRSGAAFHRAAAALHRSDAGERAGSRTAWDVLPLTRPSCRRFRSGSTSRKKAASSYRPSSAWW